MQIAAQKEKHVMRTEIAVPGLGPALSHYTDAVRFGDLLFISGIVALDADGGILHKGDVVGQAECIFQSISKILDAAGASFSDILKVTVFLTDVADRAKINDIRKKYFGDAKPASTLIGIKELALPDLMVEVEAVVGLRT
ncbi:MULTISPECIES: RidA family protein [unclassified Shinella]|uniref:RidA family protein n=1 Tax=unclassified Shinella TaxID=2643062 RepID=UPI00234E5668|nr:MULTISPECIES: RidA family protein [unclassified Shinella]MCO5149266.1 RidA family protein [Shinella sp.]MDC7265320.1 RidA family protein [Shinella sp. HY16]MDC7272217.1 RidA family protein [Shinella sp. YZ44]